MNWHTMKSTNYDIHTKYIHICIYIYTLLHDSQHHWVHRMITIENNDMMFVQTMTPTWYLIDILTLLDVINVSQPVFAAWIGFLLEWGQMCSPIAWCKFSNNNQCLISRFFKFHFKETWLVDTSCMIGPGLQGLQKISFWVLKLKTVTLHDQFVSYLETLLMSYIFYINTCFILDT